MSQTACPHCGSTNSIQTAGQRYCADCGQIIGAKKEVKNPESKAVQQKAPLGKSRRQTPPLNLKAIEDFRKPQAPVAGPGVLDLKNTAHKPPSVKKPVGRHVPPVHKSAHIPDAEPVIAKASIAEVHVPVSAHTFQHMRAIGVALKSLVVGKNLGLALTAVVVITISQIVFASLFAKSGLYAITESIAAGSLNSPRATTLLGHVAWASLIGLVGYLVYVYAMAKMVLTNAQRADGQTMAASQTRRHALASLSGIVMVDIVTSILAIITLVLVAGANFGFLGTKSLGLVGLLLALLVNIIAVYVWLGLITSRIMAMYAIVLGQLSLHRAYAAGWALYSRQFARLSTAVILMTALSAAVSVPVVVMNSLLGYNSALALVAALAASALVVAVLMVVTSVYFLQLYRYAVSREYDSQLSNQLSGGKPRKVHLARRLASLAVITVIWASIASALIVYSSPVANAIFR